MTRVKLRRTRCALLLSARGHADTPAGCAAVSALLQGLALWALRTRGVVRLTSGTADIAVPLRCGGEAAGLVLGALALVARAEPGSVSLEEA